MDELGITKGCAMVVTPNSRTTRLTAQSATNPRAGGGESGFCGILLLYVMERGLVHRCCHNSIRLRRLYQCGRERRNRLRTPQASRGGRDAGGGFRLQYPRLVSLLARITGDRGKAEELASEVFCRLSSRPVLLRPDSNLDGWLYRTAVNLGMDALRMASRRRRHEQAAGSEALRVSSAGDALSDMLGAERRGGVQAVLAGIKPVSARLLLAPQCRVVVRRTGGGIAAEACVSG